MADFFRSKVMFFILLVCLAGEIAGFAYLFLSLKGGSSAANSAAARSTPALTATHASGARGCTLAQNGFESGVVFPRWSTRGYGAKDSDWMQQLPRMKSQTAACWVEMPIEFQQSTLTSTVVSPGITTPSITSFTQGIQYARAQKFHVFVSLLLHVPSGVEHWAGQVKFTDLAQEQAWFASYWSTIQPYVAAAQQAGAEQLALGTEEQWLEDHAPASLWHTLISQVHGIFSGALTYDVNWTALEEDPPAWLHDPLLKMIGVSAYAPILTTSKHVEPSQMPALWAEKVQSLLDQFSSKLGEPIFISEVGYRNSSDAFYQPWQPKSKAAQDNQEQQGACAAVLKNALADQHLLGSFFWAWDGAGALNLKDSLAATALHQYYQQLASST